MEDEKKQEVSHNFLPKQYETTGVLEVNHNYLKEQFANSEEIIEKIKKLLETSDFTLGKEVDEFEQNFAKITNTKYAIGVGSGTDALFLSLKSLGIKQGDEVITTPYTFFATIGAIAATGATPVFVDVSEDYNINPELIESAITEKTKAIMPVHWSGLVCKMDKILEIAKKHNLKIVEDSCHGIKAEYKGKKAGSFGDLGCFSMHPLKNLNVWGDGGVIVTNSKELHDKLVLLRNHGLINRDICNIYGHNSRLDTIQAIVANTMLKKIDHITESRIKNALYYDEALSKIPQIKVPKRFPDTKQVFHIYVIKAQKRNELQKFLIENKIDAKIHYPIPMHLQPAASHLGYKEGDFPIAEETCKSILSLPVHEFITKEQQDFVIQKIKEFYNKNES